jgi:hypothetical protein
MPLSPDEELELLKLEEEEYQHSLKPAAASANPLAAQAATALTPEQVEEADRQFQAEQGARELEAAGTGALQGATFGFSDEIGAGVDVLGDVLKGAPSQKSLADKYREYQKLRESANKQLADESPWAYTGGELAGGVASSLVMPTMGAARIAGTAGRVSPKLAKFLAGQSESALGRIAGKGANLGIQGAPVGGLYGAGASEADLSRPTELASDIASGVGMGSIIGLALGATAQSSKEMFRKAGSIASDRPYLRQVKASYDMGEEGINLASGKMQGELSLLPNEKAQGFVSKIMATDKEIGKKVGAAIDDAQAKGILINIDPEVQSVGEKIYKTIFVENPTLGEFVEPRTAKLLKLIASRDKGDITPIEARALKDQLYKLTDNLAGFNSDTANFARRMGLDLAKEVDVAMKNSIPEYQIAAREFEAFRRLVPETIMSKATPSEYGQVYMGDLKNPGLKLFQTTRDLLKKAQLPGESASTEKATFEQLKRNLMELQQTNPDALKTLGGSAEEIIEALKKESDQLAAVRISTGIDPQAGIGEAGKGGISGLSTTGRGLLVSGANLAGRISGSIPKVQDINKKFIDLGIKTGETGYTGLAKGMQYIPGLEKAGKSLERSTANLSRSLYKINDEGLQSLAERLKSKESTALLGSALENALINKNNAGKNAVLFKLMQNPEYRNLLREEGLSEEEEQNE